jgi:hypothetical protein
MESMTPIGDDNPDCHVRYPYVKLPSFTDYDYLDNSETKINIIEREIVCICAGVNLIKGD